MQPKYQGACWVFLAASFYASTALLGKWVHLLQVSMVKIFCWRYAIAALLFWSVLQVRKTAVPLPFKTRLKCFAMGLLGDTSRTALFFFTITRIGASFASLLLYTFPLFVFLIQRFVFAQPASSVQWMGLILSSIGCALTINPFTGGAVHDWMGLVAGIACGLVQGIYISLSSRFIKGVPTTVVVSYVTRGAFVTFLCAALYTGELAFPATVTDWQLGLSLAFCATVVPVFCLMKAIPLIGAAQTSVLMTIEPVLTILSAFLLFEEPLSLVKVLGIVLILSAALMVQGKEELVAEGEKG